MICLICNTLPRFFMVFEGLMPPKWSQNPPKTVPRDVKEALEASWRRLGLSWEALEPKPWISASLGGGPELRAHAHWRVRCRVLGPSETLRQSAQLTADSILQTKDKGHQSPGIHYRQQAQRMTILTMRNT